jgi:hypothetical protein
MHQPQAINNHRPGKPPYRVAQKSLIKYSVQKLNGLSKSSENAKLLKVKKTKDQISIKTQNPKCRLFSRILAVNVRYLGGRIQTVTLS